MNRDALHLAERWALLLPEQRTHVARALNRAIRDARRFARASNSKATIAPQPYNKKHKRRAGWEHAANAGALTIARDLLGALRAHP